MSSIESTKSHIKNAVTRLFYTSMMCVRKIDEKINKSVLLILATIQISFYWQFWSFLGLAQKSELLVAPFPWLVHTISHLMKDNGRVKNYNKNESRRYVMSLKEVLHFASYVFHKALPGDATNSLGRMLLSVFFAEATEVTLHVCPSWTTLFIRDQLMPP